MWTQIVDPGGLEKVLKSQSFFDFTAGRYCFVLPYPLKTIPLWVIWMTHVFWATFRIACSFGFRIPIWLFAVSSAPLRGLSSWRRTQKDSAEPQSVSNSYGQSWNSGASSETFSVSSSLFRFLIVGSGLPPGSPFRVGGRGVGQPDALLAPSSERREQRSVFLFGKLRQFPCSSSPHKGHSPLRGPPLWGVTHRMALLPLHSKESGHRGNSRPTGSQVTQGTQVLAPLSHSSLVSPAEKEQCNNARDSHGHLQGCNLEPCR